MPRLLIMLGLSQKKAGVEAMLSHQLIVRALLYDLPVLHDEDPVCHFYGGEPVADQDRCASLRELMKPLEKFCFRLGVHRTGRLIENKNLRIAHDGPGERQFLPLTNAQFMPTLEQFAK